jgi:hypothetical protein
VPSQKPGLGGRCTANRPVAGSRTISSGVVPIMFSVIHGASSALRTIKSRTMAAAMLRRSCLNLIHARE